MARCWEDVFAELSIQFRLREVAQRTSGDDPAVNTLWSHFREFISGITSRMGMPPVILRRHWLNSKLLRIVKGESRCRRFLIAELRAEPVARRRPQSKITEPAQRRSVAGAAVQGQTF